MKLKETVLGWLKEEKRIAIKSEKNTHLLAKPYDEPRFIVWPWKSYYYNS